MKVIDLYNLVVREEELPEKIKLKDYEEIYTLREDCTGYKWYGEEKEHKTFSDVIHQNLEYVLKQEVEIIEEPQEHKIPKKMSFVYKTEDDMQNANNERFKYFINAILDYLEVNNEKTE